MASSVEHQEEHDMFHEMQFRLMGGAAGWEARQRKERFRYHLRCFVAMKILATLLVAAYARLMREGVEPNPGPGWTARLLRCAGAGFKPPTV